MVSPQNVCYYDPGKCTIYFVYKTTGSSKENRMPQSPENFLIFSADGSVSVREGKADILVRKPTNQSHSKVDDGSSNNDTAQVGDEKLAPVDTEEERARFAETVFYNPIQEFNRDMSILGISAFNMMESTRRRETNMKEEEKRLRREAYERGEKPAPRVQQAAKKVEPVKEEQPLTPTSTEKDTDSSEEPSSKKRCTISRKEYKLAKHDKKLGSGPKPTSLQGLPRPVLHYLKEYSEKKQYVESAEGQNKTAEEFKDWIKDPPKFSILEALAASGLRSIRYAKELPGVNKILTNDLDPNAVKSIRENSIHNKVDDIITPNEGDASMAIYTNPGYTVIDLDPYGSASPFLDAAVKNVANGGLLCVTCTDLAVLAGSQSDSCYAKYGVMAVANAPYCHEMALRTLLQSVATTAAKYKRSIKPLASFSIDFYVRIFIQVEESSKGIKELVGHTGMFYHCTYCKTVFTQVLGKSAENGDGNKKGPAVPEFRITPECNNCKGSYHIGGPLWLKPIHDVEFLNNMKYILKNTAVDSTIKDKEAHNKNRNNKKTPIIEDPTFNFSTYKRMEGMIELAYQELPTHFYYCLADLSSVVHVMQPSLATFLSGVMNVTPINEEQGKIVVSQTHCKPNCFKTNATPEQVWGVLRDWIKTHPVKRIKAQSVANILRVDWDQTTREIINKEEITEDEKAVIDKKFVMHDDINNVLLSKVVRFQENPTKNWGPKAKAKKQNPDE